MIVEICKKLSQSLPEAVCVQINLAINANVHKSKTLFTDDVIFFMASLLVI